MINKSKNCISPTLEFSYSQFFVHDAGITNPACEWTEAHSRQGFARRDGVAAIGTLLEYGRAEVTLDFGSPQLHLFERVVAVPLEIKGGAIAVDGPEEDSGVREMPIKNGHYRATIAQRIINGSTEEIGIWLEELALPLEHSELLVVDEALKPQFPLVEIASKP
jgi:hypothetical protein